MKKLNDVIWIKNNSGNIVSNKENIQTVKNLLNDTGCGFCLAKFTQVTMHLGTGLVHSCHHPKAGEGGRLKPTLLDLARSLFADFEAHLFFQYYYLFLYKSVCLVGSVFFFRVW